MDRIEWTKSSYRDRGRIKYAKEKRRKSKENNKCKVISTSLLTA